MNRRSCPLILAVRCLLFGMPGCGSRGPKMARVDGVISLDGIAIPDGRIQFEDVQGQVSSAGGKIEQGQYRLEALPAQMRVRITAYREVPGKFLEMNPGVKTPFIEQYIPANYNEKSDLTADIVAGKNEVNFELKSSDAKAKPVTGALSQK